MKKYSIIAVIVIGIALTGLFIYYQNEQSLESDELVLTTEPAIEKEEVEEVPITKITVEIKGEVNAPGVYQIEETARVNDLIVLAGGLTENAVTNNINLAKKLKDEMVIIIYNKNDLVKEVKTEYVYLACECPEIQNDACIKEEEEPKTEENKKDENYSSAISINTATKEELMTLNGIGEKTAEKIITYRKENPFKTIEDIKNVSGIGESLYEKIKDSITI